MRRRDVSPVRSASSFLKAFVGKCFVLFGICYPFVWSLCNSGQRPCGAPYCVFHCTYRSLPTEFLFLVLILRSPFLPIRAFRLCCVRFGEYVALFSTTWKLAHAPGPVILFFRQATWSGLLYMSINWGDLLANYNIDVSFFGIRSGKPMGESPLVATTHQRHMSPGDRKIYAGPFKDGGSRTSRKRPSDIVFWE